MSQSEVVPTSSSDNSIVFSVFKSGVLSFKNYNKDAFRKILNKLSSRLLLQLKDTIFFGKGDRLAPIKKGNK